MKGEAERYRGWLAAWRHADQPLAPFHWEIEFPEVFDRTNAGFDAFVGNPPFAGKNTTATANVAGYTDWLKSAHEESHGNADLVAHFFRRSFNLLRAAGAFGLIATNTIGQGDTRSTGLRWVCQHGGEIFAVRRRDTFYRSVEVASVTPFSARALDRGFAGALVGLARHLQSELTPPLGAERIADVRATLERRLLDVFRSRVDEQPITDADEREERLRSVQNRVVDLLDSWRKVFDDYRSAGVDLQYQQYELPHPKPLLREILDKDFESEHHRKFRANRSLRDVEPDVNLFLKDLTGGPVGDGA